MSQTSFVYPLRLDFTTADYILQAKATVNFVDSRRMQELTTAAVRDSAAMKQVYTFGTCVGLAKLRDPCRFRT